MVLQWHGSVQFSATVSNLQTDSARFFHRFLPTRVIVLPTAVAIYFPCASPIHSFVRFAFFYLTLCGMRRRFLEFSKNRTARPGAAHQVRAGGRARRRLPRRRVLPAVLAQSGTAHIIPRIVLILEIML